VIEPPNAGMIGYSREAAERLKVVIFYVCDPSVPFPKLVRQQPRNGSVSGCEVDLVLDITLAQKY
jgi:hypothetical protein